MGFRAIALSVFVFGLALAAAWHAAAPLTEGDALRVAAILGGGPGTSPPGPVSERLLDVGMRAVRAIWAPTGLFRAAHLAGGLWLAIAAALTAGVAARSAAGRHPRAGTGLAAGLFAGVAVLLGADTGRLGLEASPVPVLLALLAGSATAFTARRPWPFLGGLLAGLAVADHPFVLFLLPAWGALALGSTLRDRPGNAGRTIRTGWFGFALGLLALLMTGPARAALAAWIGGPGGPFWRPVGPSGWGAGLLDVVFAAWHATGPLGFVLGLAGVVAFFTGRARLARPFLLAFALPAAALVLGRATDAEVAHALTGWAFVFWTVPSFAAAWGRFAGETEHGPDPPEPVMVRADFRAPVVALLAGGLLFALNSKSLDRSTDRDPAWARSVVRTLPTNAVFFTGNAAHVAYALETERPDVELHYIGKDPESRRRLPEAVERLARADDRRPRLIDTTLYFDDARRSALVPASRKFAPWGLTYQVVENSRALNDEEVAASTRALDGVDLTPDSPPNALRENLPGNDWFGRSLLRSATLWLELNRESDAEREFFLAFGHPSVNHNVAAIGLASRMFERQNYSSAAATLESAIRDDQEGAWAAHRLRANSLARLGDLAGAIVELEAALRVLPANLTRERDAIERQLAMFRELPSPSKS